MIIGIDASRSKSGGGSAHLIGIMNNLNPEHFNITTVHVWAYQKVLNAIEDKPWLVKHCPESTKGSLFKQIIWQRYTLPNELRKFKCNILLSTDAGTVCSFKPNVVMSRDMLSFEKSEIRRYGLGKDWLRLLILRYVQSSSLKKSQGAIFLTDYAAKTIQNWTGNIREIKIIPHGVGNEFKNAQVCEVQKGRSIFRCVYVSNAARYKHQWHVLRAIHKLRNEGLDVTIKFIGGGKGPAQACLVQTFAEIDPSGTFSEQIEFLPHAKLVEEISNSDIFIFASSCENMPNTLVEGMACGKPIACSNRGPMPEILKDSGVYFDPENSNEIAQAVKILISDENLRAVLAKKARILSEQYSWERCSKETFEYLTTLAKK